MRKVALIIMDGWGMGEENEKNAIHQARTPFFDHALKIYPHAYLEASGLAVGLPEGQMGNSEIGHTTIGAGSAIDTDLVMIEKAIGDNSFFENEAFLRLINHEKSHNSKIHMIGLLSDGGVHSHNTHIYAFLKLAHDQGLNNDQVVLHIFTDGRDVSGGTAIKYIKELEAEMEKTVGVIGSFGGRYFGMDRAGNHERIEHVTNILFKAEGNVLNLHEKSIADFIQNEYNEKDPTGKIDEYFEHYLCIHDHENPKKYIIDKNDGIFFFNFRADRAKQLTKAILDKQTEYNLHFVSMAKYGEDLVTDVAFTPKAIITTLGKELSKRGVKHAHISESEKFPHVTFFMNGQSDIIQVGELQHKIESRTDVKTHDEAPEMKSKEIVDAAIDALKDHDVVIINFPNTDVVGHTGNIPAVIAAAETVDMQTKRLADYVESVGGISLITADHGNAEVMIDPEGNKHVAHTTNLVPFILTDTSVEVVRPMGTLADIAPTILKLCGIAEVEGMSGKSIL
ncbi:2,3-bisphosphoglycerate-independent phosphoglycerate mutase [Candidatus Parcubacteria bacterium]|nr:2,3-bisphosphoglycerate-independent phosphoglycerate mutase [Candidatus Parcubacteria bacterium]